MFRINKIALATVALTGIGFTLGLSQPAQACEYCAYRQAQMNEYYYLGQYYNSWPAARQRIIGSVAPGSTYSVRRGSTRRYYNAGKLPTLWGYKTRSQYQTDLNMALRFGK